MRCAAITKAGERCRLDATHGSYCYQHSPETAEERHQAARRGGKAGGNGRGGLSELAGIKRDIRTVIDDVLSERIPTGAGAVAFQGYNALIRAVEQERRIKEMTEFEERLRALEQDAEGQKGGRKWGA